MGVFPLEYTYDISNYLGTLIFMVSNCHVDYTHHSKSSLDYDQLK